MAIMRRFNWTEQELRWYLFYFVLTRKKTLTQIYCRNRPDIEYHIIEIKMLGIENAEKKNLIIFAQHSECSFFPLHFIYEAEGPWCLYSVFCIQWTLNIINTILYCAVLLCTKYWSTLNGERKRKTLNVNIKKICGHMNSDVFFHNRRKKINMQHTN